MNTAPLDVMVEVQKQPDWRAKAEEHRQMARAAIRLGLRHGIPSKAFEEEYEKVRAEEAAHV